MFARAVAFSRPWVRQTQSSAEAAAQRLQTLFDSRDVADLLDGIRAGKRLALSRAITLVESTRAEHKEAAAALLSQLTPASLPTANARVAGLRVGVSGPPGAGKSTLIETLGCHLVARGSKVAVLAVDPSSTQTGGSVLGDKTRMAKLSTLEDAYVRPTPSRGTLGGVARATSDAVTLCEAAGFPWVLIETVGVGQSEVAVSELCDLMLLVVPPLGGDELQVIKRGITQMADVVAVNKADGDAKLAARRAAASFKGAMHFHRPRREAWSPAVLTVSAVTKDGVPELEQVMLDFREATLASGELQRQRRQQAVSLTWKAAEEGLLEELADSTGVKEALATLKPRIANGLLGPRPAAEALLAALRAEWSDPGVVGED